MVDEPGGEPGDRVPLGRGRRPLREPLEAVVEAAQEARAAVPVRDDRGALDVVEDGPQGDGVEGRMVEPGDVVGDDPLEQDVVLPQRVVGVKRSYKPQLEPPIFRWTTYVQVTPWSTAFHRCSGRASAHRCGADWTSSNHGRRDVRTVRSWADATGVSRLKYATDCQAAPHPGQIQGLKVIQRVHVVTAGPHG
jgi:hypothetical protein